MNPKLARVAGNRRISSDRQRTARPAVVAVAARRPCSSSLPVPRRRALRRLWASDATRPQGPCSRRRGGALCGAALPQEATGAPAGRDAAIVRIAVTIAFYNPRYRAAAENSLVVLAAVAVERGIARLGLRHP
jgi:hypothetical protein